MQDSMVITGYETTTVTPTVLENAILHTKYHSSIKKHSLKMKLNQ